MQLARHNQVQASERTLVQSRQQNTRHDQHRVDFFDQRDRRLQVETLEHVREKFKKQDRGVGHYAHAHFEHDRVWIHVDELMPYEPRPTKIEQQPHDEKDIAQERGEHCRANNLMQAFYIEKVDCADDAKPACGQHDATKAVEADPESPWKLVRHIGDSAQSAKITNVGGIQAESHDHSEYGSPKGKFDFHCAPPFFLISASAAATSSRR